LAGFGSIWQHLAAFGSIWQHLAAFGSIKNFLFLQTASQTPLYKAT
jgi:hypothetical protein